MKKILAFSILVFCLLAYQEAFAEIVVVSVKGQAAYKVSGQWVPMQQGQSLPEGAKISTGAASTVTLRINGNAVTVKPLTMMKIAQSRLGAGQSDTRISLRRGTIRAKVNQDKKVKTIFKVSTPIATSSVRGTEEIISYGPNKGMVVRVIEGRILGHSKDGHKKYLSGRLVFRQKPGNSYPEPLLVDVMDEALADVQNRGVNLSSDEKTNYTNNPDEGTQNAVREGEQRVEQSSNANVRLYIQWH